MFSKTIRGIQALKNLNFKVHHFLVPIAFTLLSVGFDAISFALLIPLGEGAISMDYSFVHDITGFKQVIAVFPALGESSLSTFILIMAAIVASILLKLIFFYAGNAIISMQTERFMSTLRKMVFANFMKLGKHFFDRHNLGRLTNLLINFNDMIGGQLRGLHTVIGALFTLLAYFIVMFFISWELTLFSLLLYPIMHYSLEWLVRKIRKTSGFFAQAQAQMSHNTYNVLSNIPLVKLYTNETKEKEQFKKDSDTLCNFRYSMQKKQLLIAPLQELLMVFNLLLLVSVVAYIVSQKGPQAIPGFMVFFLLLRRSGVSIQTYTNFRGGIASISAPIAAVKDILNLKDKPVVQSGQTLFQGLKKKIRFREFSFAYEPDRPILKNLSFTIEKGGMTAIVGPSGSGKTTLIAILLRFYDIENGRLFIDGMDIKDLDIPSLRKHMALVSQDTLLFNDTLRRNIAYGVPEADDARIMAVCRQARLDPFLEKLPKGLDTVIGDKGVQLSGGEKQRVSIARALLKNTEILILDEATSSLDSRTEKLIQQAIDEAVKGRTSIVIAHRLSTIKHADKIVVIEDGCIQEEGDMQELLAKKGRFHTYWSEQKFD